VGTDLVFPVAVAEISCECSVQMRCPIVTFKCSLDIRKARWDVAHFSKHSVGLHCVSY